MKILNGQTDDWKIYSEFKRFKLKERYLTDRFGNKIQTITEEDYKEYNSTGNVEQVAYNVFKRFLYKMIDEIETFKLDGTSSYHGNTLVISLGTEKIRIAATHEEAKEFLKRNKFPFTYDHNIKAWEENKGAKEYEYRPLYTCLDSHYVGHDKNKIKSEKI